MPLRPAPEKRTREMILVYGLYGSGKSYAWAQLRRWYEMMGNTEHFHIISTEPESADRTAEGFLDGELGNNFDSNATIHSATDFDSLVEVSKKVYENGQPGDWLIVDSITNPNEWSRDVYCQTKFGFSWAEFKAAGKQVNEIGPTGWNEIKMLYNSWFVNYIVNFPGHRFACAREEAIRADFNREGKASPMNDKGETKGTFGPVGFKPSGRKELAFDYHSILWMAAPRLDEYVITTVDDPSREKLRREPCPDFVQTYMMGPAGWRVEQ